MGAQTAAFSPWAWLTFAAIVIGLLSLDLFVIHRKAREVPFREAMWLTAFWISVSLAFGGFVWAVAGSGAADEYHRPLRVPALRLAAILVFLGSEFLLEGVDVLPARDAWSVVAVAVRSATPADRSGSRAA